MGLGLFCTAAVLRAFLASFHVGFTINAESHYLGDRCHIGRNRVKVVLHYIR